MKNLLLAFTFLLGTFTLSSQTFTEDIADIIYNKCGNCHRPGQIGPMSLTNYEEVKNWAQTIKFVTATRYMPPWQADPSYSHLLDENYLHQEQIDKIGAWVDAGTPQGPSSAEPPFPQYPSGSLLGEPDLVLSMSQAHVHPGNNKDEYRYFVLPTGLTEDKIVKAIEFRPGNTKIVHHALMFEDLLGEAAASDAQTPEYGFDDLVIQVHYAPWSTAESDLSTVNIFFADQNEVVDRMVQDSIMLPYNLANGSTFGFALFRMDPETIETFHGTMILEEDLSFLGLSPHMHLLGQDWEVYIEHTDGSRTNMIKIPEWDFNWQGNYFFPKLFTAEAGSVVHAFATYDNTSENPNNPTIPPKTVGWGENTDDEMFYLPLQYVPYQAGDENIVFDSTLSEDTPQERTTNLKPIFPNPVKDLVNIEFDMSVGTTVSIQLIDINGKFIRQLRKNEFFGAGSHLINLRTDGLQAGTYFIVLESEGFSNTEKLVKI